MHVTYGPLARHELDRLRDLLRYGFLLTEEQVRNWVGDETPTEWLLAGHVGTEVATAAIVQPRTILGVRDASVATIGGVVTAPHVRGKGLARGLMAYALRRLREQGIPWAILYPFEASFYEKLGWGVGTPMVRLTISALGTFRHPSPSGAYRLVGPLEWPRLDRIHRAWPCGSSGCLARGESEWHRLLLRPLLPRTCVHWEGDGGEGYLVYELTRPLGSPRTAGTCVVHDWAWTTPPARAALLTYLAHHAGQVGRLVLKVPLDDPLATIEGAGIEAALVRGPMVRLVDLECLQESRRSAGWRGLRLRVSDPLCPWNALEFGDPEVGAGVLETDIATLSSLLWGSLSPDMAWACGLLRGERQTLARLEELVPRRPPFFLDWF